MEAIFDGGISLTTFGTKVQRGVPPHKCLPLSFKMRALRENLCAKYMKLWKKKTWNFVKKTWIFILKNMHFCEKKKTWNFVKKKLKKKPWVFMKQKHGKNLNFYGKKHEFLWKKTLNFKVKQVNWHILKCTRRVELATVVKLSLLCFYCYRCLVFINIMFLLLSLSSFY